MTCPLCRHRTPRRLETVRVADIDGEYRRQLRVGAAAEFPGGLATLDRVRCERCDLEYFDPVVTGSPTFYAALGEAPGYYTTDRWEFATVLGRLPANPDLIDVGCGDGVFLRHVPGSRKRGLELSEGAANRAAASGLEVATLPLRDVASDSADFVTMFQVLEHVARPLELIGDALRVLRPGGRLFISVPDNDSWVGSALHDPLNAPPHHPLRWRESSLRYAARAASADVEHVVREPLADWQRYPFHRARFVAGLQALTGGRIPLCRTGFAMTAIRRAANVWSHSVCALLPTLGRNATGPSLLAVFRRRHASPPQSAITAS